MKKNKRSESIRSKQRARKFLSILTSYFINVKLFLDFFNFYKNLDEIIFAQLIPKNHLLVRINGKIDFSFVNVLCHPYYKNSGVGNKPKEPVKIFKMLLILVLYGILSERELVRQVEVNVAFRYFCGFSLTDKIPHHSTLSVFRKRIGNETFKKIFIHILQLCIQAKLVTNEMYIFDPTVVRAHSKKISPKQQAIRLYSAVMKALFGETEITNEQKEIIAEQVIDKVSPNYSAKSGSASGGKEQKDKRQQKINELKGVDVSKVISESTDLNIIELNKKKSEEIISKKGKLALFIRTIYGNIAHGIKDKSARLIKMRSTVLGYLLYLGIDKTNLVITSFDFDKANVPGHVKYIPLYEEHLENTKDCEIKIPISASCDSEFDINIEIRKRLLSDGVICNIPIRKNTTKAGLFGSQEFFLKDNETLICPANKILKAAIHRKYNDTTVFSARGGSTSGGKTKECQDCQLKNKCTNSKYRTVKINLENHYLRQTASEYNKTDQYKSAMIQRMQIEGVFGLGKMYHHLDRCYYFDKEQNYNYAALFATAHNIIKLVLHS